MNTWVFEVCVDDNEPMVSHEIDSVVNMYPTPGFLRQHPRMVGRLCWFVLMFSAGSALMTRLE